MKSMLPTSAFLRTALVVSFIAALSVACAETSSTPAGGGTTEDGSSATDGGGTTEDSGGTTTGDTGGTTGNDSGGGGSTAKEMTVKEVLKLAQGVQAKVAKCPPFANPPEGKNVSIKGLVAVSPLYTADKKKTLDGVFSQAKGGGANSGLRLVGKKADKVLTGLKVGETFDIEGQVVVFYCEVQIQVTKMTKSADAVSAPVATTVTLDDVGESASAEKHDSYEGAFVTLNDMVVADKEALGTDNKPHGEFWLGTKVGEKGLMVKTDLKFKTTFYTYDSDSKSWVTTLKDGDKISSIQGIMTFSFGHWKLLPLSDDMIVWADK
ncbi:MAG: hypothetical protein KC502_00565 [Myxococcales bacterium]|nr:hypothetical protein [Myxococcales bacterium]